ncbi:MAG: DUF2207 domain-containing protein, partial [Clostridia bacterium]|nr:DUF2207 domain-containing protein [Clostridia bacterium]
MRNYVKILRFMPLAVFIVIALPVIFEIILSTPLALMLSPNGYASNSKQILNNLDINIKLNDNGSMYVEEYWQIELFDRDKPYRNIYKSFKLNSEDNITVKDFSVHDIDNNITFAADNTIKDPSEYENSSKKNVSYTFKKGNNLELGFYMPPVTQGVRNFKLCYTVDNIITVYNDTAVFYYQELGPEFSLPVKNLNCTIITPENTQNTPLRAWLHCTAKSLLNIDSQTQVSFTADKIPAKTFVETRICLPVDMFKNSDKIIKADTLDDIVTQESNWEQEYSQRLHRSYILGVIDKIIAAIVLVLLVFLVVKHLKKNRRYKTSVPEYIRDIPLYENPGTMSEIFHYYKGRKNKSVLKNKKIFGNMLSAIMLSLAHKKYISIQPTKNNDIFITVFKNTEGTKPLASCEIIIFDYLKGITKFYQDSFTTKKMKEYSERNYAKVDRIMQSLITQIEHDCEYSGFYEQPYVTKFMRYLPVICPILIFFSCTYLLGFITFVFTALSVLFSSIILLLLLTRKPRLSLAGEIRHNEWKGLKKFILDFSNMKEYSSIHLSVWEEYLIYATAMGVSKKVSKQLKLAYQNLNPNDENPDYDMSNS